MNEPQHYMFDGSKRYLFLNVLKGFCLQGRLVANVLELGNRHFHRTINTFVLIVQKHFVQLSVVAGATLAEFSAVISSATLHPNILGKGPTAAELL